MAPKRSPRGRATPTKRLLAVALAAAAAGCGGSGAATTSSGGTATISGITGGPLTVRGLVRIPTPPRIRVFSPAFANGAQIPARYTCTGADVSPPLRWSGVPAGARELALVMLDPDAAGGPFTHWALAGIPPTDRGLPAHLGLLGAVPGRNDFGKLLYRGPCPPPGKPHHYLIELLALRTPSGLTPGFQISALKRLRPLAGGVLVGAFGRQ